jgi:hypothetical protein
MMEAERDDDLAVANREIVSKVREMFTPIAQRLTPEVEPAVIFLLPAPETE